MTVFYHINEPTDTHWYALTKKCEIDYIDWEDYNKRLDTILSRFNATLIREHHDEMWLSGIEFDNEEDLVFFKLTFN